MAVAFDAVGPDATGATTDTGGSPAPNPLTWSHTCSGSDRYLEVDIVVGDSTDDSATTIDGVTYNSVAMTLVPGSLVHSNNGNAGYVVKYGLVAPATGAHTVSVAFTSGGVGSVNVKAGSKSFTGVDQTTPYDGVTTAFGSSTTPSVAVSSAAGNMVSDAVANGAAIASSGQTLRWNRDLDTSSAGGNGAGATADGAASVTMSYSVTSDWWGIVGYNIRAAAASASAAITGTAGDGCAEADIVAGGETIVITLTGDTWVASGATFNAIRQDIIDGLDSAQSETNGWNAEVRDKEAVTAVVRTSDTVVTITLSAAAAYQITANETITVTVPGTAVTGGNPITATPTFNVTADAPGMTLGPMFGG